ncbi:MAG: DUF962 domain-containing protein [Cyclobacteriaceae bacterium]
MRKIDQLLSEYGESHQNGTNKAIHWICVPLIFFSVVGLIASIPSSFLQTTFGAWGNWATVAMVLVLIYYITLSISLTIGMAVFASLCLYVANSISTIAPLWLVCVVIFTVAWIGQFYGHKIEGKKPSFFKDLQFLLIGPAWLMHFIYKRIGIPY